MRFAQIETKIHEYECVSKQQKFFEKPTITLSINYKDIIKNPKYSTMIGAPERILVIGIQKNVVFSGQYSCDGGKYYTYYPRNFNYSDKNISMIELILYM